LGVAIAAALATVSSAQGTPGATDWPSTILSAVIGFAFGTGTLAGR